MAGPTRRISWRADDPELRYKFWQLVGQYSSLIIAFFGFLAVWSSVSAGVQNGVLTHVTSLDSFFFKHPDLYPYFYTGKQPPKPGNCDQEGPVTQRGTETVTKPSLASKPLCYRDIYLAAIRLADVLDIVGVQNTRFKSQWETPEAWDKWTIDSLNCSPILRKYLDDHRDWYSKGLIARLDEVNKGDLKCRFKIDCLS